MLGAGGGAVQAPSYGALTDPKPVEKARLADTLVVIVHDDWIRADVIVRANLILL